MVTHKVDWEEALSALYLGEIFVYQAAGEFSGPVWAEVEKNDAVAFSQLDSLQADHRLHKLVRDSDMVGVLDSLNRILGQGSLTQDDGIIGRWIRSQRWSRSMA